MKINRITTIICFIAIVAFGIATAVSQGNSDTVANITSLKT